MRYRIILMILVAVPVGCDRGDKSSQQAAAPPPAAPSHISKPTPPPPTTAQATRDETAEAIKAFPDFARRFDRAFRELFAQRQTENANKSQADKDLLDVQRELGSGYKADVHKTDSLLTPVVGEIQIPYSATMKSSVRAIGLYTTTHATGRYVINFKPDAGKWILASASLNTTDETRTTDYQQPVIDPQHERNETKDREVNLTSDKIMVQAAVQAQR
jgi:hypothetical protein